MTIALAFAAGMFVVGAIVALVLNVELASNVAQAKTRSPESAAIMAWLLRSSLVLLPVVLAIAGAIVGPEIVEGSL
jgi:hypothetical protein